MKYTDPITSWKRDADFKGVTHDEKTMQYIRSDSRLYAAFLERQQETYRQWRYHSK